MKEIQVEECPFCGGKELIECRLSAYAGVYLERGMHGAGVYTLVCRDCGSIVRSYCKEPEELYSKKERRI